MTPFDTRAVRERLALVSAKNRLSPDDRWWLFRNLGAACVLIDALRPAVRVDAHEPTVAVLICEETMD